MHDRRAPLTAEVTALERQQGAAVLDGKTSSMPSRWSLPSRHWKPSILPRPNNPAATARMRKESGWGLSDPASELANPARKAGSGTEGGAW